MKTKWIVLAAIFQLLVLAIMAGQREWILGTGKTIYLQTVPLDPRDFMRGDYVHLNYDISSVPRNLWRGRLAKMELRQLPADTVVYAALNLTNGSVAELTGIDLDPPSKGCYIRGRTGRQNRWGNNGVLQVRYGIEAFFTQQGRAEKIEREGRDRDGVFIPMEMEAALGPNGIAVLKDYRKSKLGISLVLDRGNSVTRTNNPPVVGATLKLVNVSSNTLAVVDSMQCLTLVPENQWSGGTTWEWKPVPVQEPLRVVTLRPGQAHQFKITFSDSYWNVVKKEKDKQDVPMSFTKIGNDWSARFRIEYRTPDESHYAGLPNGAQIWHGKILSTAFNTVSGVD